MRHLKKHNEDVNFPGNLEEELLEYIFDILDRNLGGWLEDDGLENLETPAQLWKFIFDHVLMDHDHFNDIGHISSGWIEKNIDYIFTRYKEV